MDEFKNFQLRSKNNSKPESTPYIEWPFAFFDVSLKLYFI